MCEIGSKKEKKLKADEEAKKLGVLFATNLRSMEVVVQPC